MALKKLLKLGQREGNGFVRYADKHGNLARKAPSTSLFMRRKK